jgi:uncharacterized protein YggU (UPF0235/DUF167 family)
MMGKPWSRTANGISLIVRLTPKVGRDAIDGIELLADARPALKLRVTAAAGDGEASTALIRLIAAAMHIPRRDVMLATGAAGRIKRLVISGDGPTLIAALEKIATPR